MATDGEAKMTRQAFSIAYSGAARLDDHAIDVETLAPALLAFGKLIRATNAEFNGNTATAKVVVVSDFEHRCFNINFETIVSIIDQIKGILGIIESTKSAKEILEYVGILSGTGGISFLGYLKWKRGRKVVEKTEVTDQDESGIVKIKVEGDNNSVVIHQHIYNLAQNPKALKATRDALTPIGQDGFDRIELKDGEHIIDSIEPEETQAILASCNEGIEEADKTVPDIESTTAWLSVYSPVYDAAADKWRFRLGTTPVYVDISETAIAQNALSRGGSMVDDTYQARLEITTPRTRTGKPGKPSYKILRVIKFVPSSPAIQASLFDGRKTDDPKAETT
jgi:hypothetical protein